MTTIKTISNRAARVLADLVREANPNETLPTDDRDLLAAVDHNLVRDNYDDAEQAAAGSVQALVTLRNQMGLPIFR